MPRPSPATLPEPPYYAVVFTAVRTPGDHGYAETDERLFQLAADQPGFLGVDSARGANGLGITVSYWRDEESISAWREHAEHTLARARGRERWYASFALHVARVERAHRFTRLPEDRPETLDRDLSQRLR
ncbi:antibiotic biosynthesis monooxygenase [Streptomyces sp. NRRL B-24085]|uniref:antibiotic biosynthesis monooxygenase family protein n=1 Tax=Streptomyces sp. NRRL B-24085 TaxID=1709476 RepID=UPI0006B31735|nr:antibiotic biosynthesis monooxygenase [Streptomyces sp. NRRL B-24085]